MQITDVSATGKLRMKKKTKERHWDYPQFMPEKNPLLTNLFGQDGSIFMVSYQMINVTMVFLKANCSFSLLQSGRK